jgi:hypothetical protein
LLLVPLLLTGCSGLTPVYGEHGLTQQRFELAYSEPASRLDQIVIQDLALKLGKSDSDDAPLVTISTSPGAIGLTRTSVSKPRTEYEAQVTVSYTLVADGAIIGSGSRRGTAGYATVGQVLADDAAYHDALERAARAAAETVRLSLLAHLATPPRVSPPLDE